MDQASAQFKAQRHAETIKRGLNNTANVAGRAGRAAAFTAEVTIDHAAKTAKVVGTYIGTFTKSLFTKTKPTLLTKKED